MAPLFLTIDRWLAGKGGRQFAIPAGLAIASFVVVSIVWMIFSGPWINEILTQDYVVHNVFDEAFYLLFTNGGQNLSPGSHFWGAVVTVLGILILAVVTLAITNFFEKSVEDVFRLNLAQRRSNKNLQKR